MPLTDKGKKVLAEMIAEYGTKKGRDVFYASMNKDKPVSESWHLKSKKK